jgi:integrase
MIREQCPTVAQYGREWLDSPLREWGDGTIENYDNIFNLHIKPHLGSKRLNEIKRRDVKDFIGKLDGLSPARKSSIVAVLSGIFENAVDDEILQNNPCQNTGKHCGSGALKEIVPLSAEEVQVMLENAASYPIEVYTAFLLAVRTGLRAGELVALRWSDVDFENRFIEVTRTYNHRWHKFGLPKNKKSRKVDLSPACVEALRILQRNRKVASIDRDDLIFVGNNGRPMNYYYLRKIIKKIAPRPIRLHDLRHSYATLRIAKGDNILDVSKQLGHHKVAFTIDKYGHWIPGEHKSQVDELDTLHLSAPYVQP